MKSEPRGSSPQKILFTSASVYSELNNQGITSLKGEIGAFILYRNIHLAYYNGERKISARIFIDLCFDVKPISSKRVFIGEFIVKRESNFNPLVTDKYCIELNTTITKVI